MRWRWRKVLVYSTGLILIALSVLIYIRFTERYRTEVTMMTTLKPIRLLQPGEPISAALLREVQIPKAAHDDTASTRLEDLAGQTALVPIGPNEELVRWKLTDYQLVPGAGERYYSFKTDRLQNDANLVRRGDRVDVWVEFDSPKWLKEEGTDSRLQIAGVKLIEGLLVAGVKTAEGAEVTDAGGLDQLIGSVRKAAGGNERMLIEQGRSKPSGLPDTNTYVMSEEIYNAYLLGSLGGHIKLALPDWNSRMDEYPLQPARLTDTYLQLADTDIFSKEGKKQEVTVDRIVREDVK